MNKQTTNIVKNYPDKGSLQIIKYDEDDPTKTLAGAVFSVKNNYSVSDAKYYENNNVTTGSDGKVQLDNLPFGKYTITEIQAPPGYNINLQSELTKEIDVDENNTETKPVVLEFCNKKYGNLEIIKVDEDTKKIIEEKDVEFKIYVKNESDETKTYISNYTKGNPSELVYTNDENEALIFKTEDNGRVPVIENIPIDQTYYIEEYKLPNNLSHYYVVKGTVDAVTLKPNTEGNTVVYVTNKQRYVDISGYVWEDRPSEKMNIRNNLRNNDSNDNADNLLVPGIKVRLKHENGTTIAETTTDENGAYKFEGKVINEDGTTKVQIEINGDKLKENYYIEFEYNGLRYQSVPTMLDADNGSKAIEKEADRMDFNNSYSSITGGNIKGDNATKGYSINEDGIITNNLTYKNGTYTSTLVSETGYTVDSANDYVDAQNGSVGVLMKADTQAAEYTIEWTPGVLEIKNINLGIYDRPQPDLAIASDLDSVDLTFGDYSHTYLYDKRAGLYSYDDKGELVGTNIFSELTKYVEEKQPENYPKEYTRSIYRNYIYASVSNQYDDEEEAKLELYSTYKITIKNWGSLYMTVNEIANYYKDTDSEIIESWYADSNGNKVDVTWYNKGVKDEYREIRTDSLKNVYIPPKGSIDIYLKMKKSNNKIVEWSSKTEGCVEEVYNVAEIASYSSYTKDDKGNYVRYAGIDKNSAPDNIKPGESKTYEDDTDSAPVLKIMLDEPRTISGYVFEDNTSVEINPGEERKGDGKYAENEDGYVNNVKVELIKINENNEEDVAKIYPYARTNNNINYENAECTTTIGDKGKYEFVGVIPGIYKLKFTYNNGSEIYKTIDSKEVSTKVSIQNYKSTIISQNIREILDSPILNKNEAWYQKNVGGYSIACDDMNTRNDINDKYKTINYKNKTDYENSNDDNYMVARTQNMNIAIENLNNEETKEEDGRVRVYENLNFGIVERPRQQLNVYKDISYIKLKLANNHVLAEGNPTEDNIPYVTYLKENGILKMEVDSEIVQDSTLEVTYEIKVENNSELDYNTENYYKYGEIDDENSLVKTNIGSIVDYMDENLITEYKYEEPDGEWHIATKNNSNKTLDNIKIESDAYNAISNNKNVLVKNINKELSPKGEEEDRTMKIEVKASKLLSTSKDTTYKNNVELLQVSNSVGRFYGQKDDNISITKWKLITPGNLNILKGPQEIDEAKVSVAIVPPTGQNRIYYVIGISCLVILLGGIILIKKKVLD